MKNAEQFPKLDRPGAGLPGIERFLAKQMIARSYRKSTRESVATELESECGRIETLVAEIDPEAAGQQVLIKRLRGLEDSSRFWSVYMVLDHLRIVNDAITEALPLLERGETPGIEADTARVKPDPEAGEECLESFRESCRRLAATVASIKDLKTEASYAHPWFGPMDASQWHHMAVFHIALHRKQIEAILAGLQSGLVRSE